MNSSPTPDSTARATPSIDLGLAAYNGDLAKVRRLLAQGADVNAPSWAGRTALMNALSAIIGEPSKVSGPAPPDPRTRKQYAHKRQIAQLLLSKGANPDAANELGLAPLHYAVRMPGDEPALLPIVRDLLKRGAKVDPRTTHDVTPLLLALQHKREALARVLLDAGADPRAADKSGDTPESLAAKLGMKAFLAHLRSKTSRP